MFFFTSPIACFSPPLATSCTTRKQGKESWCTKDLFFSLLNKRREFRIFSKRKLLGEGNNFEWRFGRVQDNGFGVTSDISWEPLARSAQYEYENEAKPLDYQSLADDKGHIYIAIREQSLGVLHAKKWFGEVYMNLRSMNYVPSFLGVVTPQGSRNFLNWAYRRTRDAHTRTRSVFATQVVTAALTAPIWAPVAAVRIASLAAVLLIPVLCIIPHTIPSEGERLREE